MTNSIMKPIAGSSNIKGAGYDEDTRTLIVAFISGATYTYDNVPPEAFDAFMAADSKGRHFMRHIRKKFTGSIIPARIDGRPVNQLAAG